ncbi:hypothetical protein FE257_011989 [Aspergillus nanangensis]|uniref:BZIP transcription factor n=1 Tax=Aspergillus nanangensis TaxID=2582783 RepID=A0AAD4CGP5_ASPNN|nr:hypothetical protein FE257_011989 [Aspergillus nanangensis]
MDNPNPNNNLNRRTTSARRKPRNVSSLSTQQIQHKRDLDRKAQRALRQRVKCRLQDLEEDLARAKSSSSDRERKMMDEIQALRDENRKLRSCLESIGQFALDGAAMDRPSGSPDSGPVEEEEHEPIDESLELANQEDVVAMAASGAEPRAFANCGPEPEHRDQYLDGSGEDYHQHHQHHHLTVLSPSSSISSSAIASVLPRHSSSVCPLDTILLDFMSSRRAMLAKGYTMDAVLGPSQPSLQAILHSENPTALHATSRVLTEILSTFPHVALPEKAAFMFVMFRTMRWQLCPTDSNYEAMPRWLRPTAIQITIPHSAWIDNIPWPQVRDILIQNPEKYPHSVFSELYSQHVTINWPYGSMDTVFNQDDHVILNPIFEKHVRRLSNWTVSSQFKDYLPEMMDAIGSSN